MFPVITAAIIGLILGRLSVKDLSSRLAHAERICRILERVVDTCRAQGYTSMQIEYAHQEIENYKRTFLNE